MFRVLSSPSRSLAAALLMLTIPACLSVKKKGEHGTEAGDMAYTVLSDAELPVIDASEVQMFRKGDELPLGLRRVGGYYKAGSHPEEYILADGDYPSAADSHRVVGRLGIVRGKGMDDTVALNQLVQAAAENGANAVVLVGESHKAYIGVALRISDAEVDPPFPSAKNVLKDTPEELAGFAKVGKAHERDLSDFEPVTWPAKPMTCYAIHLALDADAALTRGALDHLQVVPKGLERGTMGFQLTDEARIRDRSFSVEVGCTRKAAEAELARFQALAVDKTAGSGGIRVQLFSRKSSGAEIAERVAAHDKKVKSQQAAHDAAGREVARKACQRCLAVRLTKCKDGDPQGCGAYKSCLSRSAVRVSECP